MELSWRVSFSMGKKKQLKKLATSNIQILKSGKIKFTKGQKINLKSFVEDSIKNTVVSRLDGIISKEDVIIDTSDLRVDISSNMTTDIKTAELASRVNSPRVSTIVITTNKKNATEIFDFLDESTLGVILRTSTLASIYSKSDIKKRWSELNKEDNSSFTNVLFVPNVMVFIDPETGKIRKSPYYINVLVLAVPSIKKMSEGIEEVSDDDARACVIADICDSAIKCGCKDVIVDPYNYKLFNKDYDNTATLWKQISTSQRFIEQFNSFTFTIDNEELFIIFNSKRNN